MSIHDDVKCFHQKFGHPVAEKPVQLSDDRARLRARLIAEEAFEVLEAFFAEEEGSWIRDQKKRLLSRLSTAKVGMTSDLAKELADLDYVVEGTRVEMGVKGKPIHDLVHEANMSKVGFKDEHGKICKGSSYVDPYEAVCKELQMQAGITERPVCGYHGYRCTFCRGRL